jgi:hypothetical protein
MFLKSVRLAVVLILVITILSLLSTLVPQGGEDSFYSSQYPYALYRLITILDFNRFFSSLLFLVLAGLFAVNLGVCAVDRFMRRARSKAEKRYGADVVHIGLLLLLAGAVVTGLARQEKDFNMAEGDTVNLTKDYSIKLLSFRTVKYENGSPRSWTSTVDVLRAGKLERSSFPIRVNHPLRLRGVSVYQTSFGQESTLVLRDRQGNEVTARGGQGFQDGESFWYFAQVVQDGDMKKALFQEYKGNEVVSMRKLAPSQSVGPYTLLRLESREVTGLRAVNDPGFLPVVIALIIVAAGLALTFIQRKRVDTA